MGGPCSREGGQGGELATTQEAVMMGLIRRERGFDQGECNEVGKADVFEMHFGASNAKTW